jgi:hypothetical protein
VIFVKKFKLLIIYDIYTRCKRLVSFLTKRKLDEMLN